ncbi:MAG: hypothetical protein PVH61_31590 [Candidatus Aminicenantes bacterium]
MRELEPLDADLKWMELNLVKVPRCPVCGQILSANESGVLFCKWHGKVKK